MIKDYTKIQEEIKKDIIEKDSNSIVDGIINTDKYAKAHTRILWVLKEPNSSDIGWTYQSYLSIEDIEKKIGTKENTVSYELFRRMFYISYGLLSEMDYDNLPVAEKLEVYGVGEEIAYINIKKTGGEGESKDSEIKQAYQENEALLLKQIAVYNPNIIIFGGTLKFFDYEKLKEIGWDLKERKIVDENTNNTHYYPISKEKLVIYPYHPSYFIKTRAVYCSEIINAGKFWRELF
ncbi:hypothetical protein [Tenacibaculum haliotis]|uniref:hypothetical protein n=1 Tax=Tenacibaculum haliotis TaxID=1888914 RepID=UPI0021AF19DE|nr:hypothetical protein [Tenacibaculum haliotis]MCT4697888.1 hypothetical protein [Tenacibaculum haliotis]